MCSRAHSKIKDSSMIITSLDQAKSTIQELRMVNRNDDFIQSPESTDLIRLFSVLDCFMNELSNSSGEIRAYKRIIKSIMISKKNAKE